MGVVADESTSAAEPSTSIVAKAPSSSNPTATPPSNKIWRSLIPPCTIDTDAMLWLYSDFKLTEDVEGLKSLSKEIH